MNDDSFFSKKGQRKVSSFVGQELLYDYMTGQLDEERQKAVQDFIRLNKEAQMDMQKIQNGLSYAEKISQTKVSEALIERVSLPTNYTQVLMQKIRFEEWSPAFRMGLEATIVALGIMVVAVLIPWHKLMDLKIGSKDIILTEVDKNYVSKPVAETETSVKEEVVFPDEVAPTTTLKTAAAKTATPTSVTTTTSTLVTTTTGAIAKTPVTLPKAAPVEKAVTTSAVATASPDEKRQGELYRGVVAVTNVNATSQKLIEKIKELGGRKAGQVELGWNKNGDSAYFHFTMPASQYDELLAAIQEYGTLKIQKEKHERVMPEGIMRLIITVDEKK